MDQMQANTEILKLHTDQEMDLGLDLDTEELRHHVHYLLHDYSRTHLTTNYIEFTENLVAEV